MPVSYNSMHTIDINCDLGEGYTNDAELMQYISSANIACGFHAGNEAIIKKTIELCLKNNNAIGAHPGFNDKENFGRINIQLSNDELYDLIAEQITLLQAYCKQAGTKLHHVKPHGALYNMAAINASMSYTIAAAIKEVDDSLIVYGLSNSELIIEANKLGLVTAAEVFADRTYQSDGTLTPRSMENALITNVDDSLHQCLQMIQHQQVTAVNNSIISIIADTICIHGDGIHAVNFAKSLHQLIINNSIQLKTIGA